jgi:ABC-type nitrate/sulfonate/bicarbonate transport system substrate-binding protein
VYERAGINLELVNTFQNTLLPLESGQVEIAQVFVADALALVEQGRDVVVLGARDVQCPIATVSLRKKGVSSPADYGGLRWGISPGFFPEGKLLPQLARRYKFEEKSIDRVHVEFSGRLSALQRGQVDIISAWYGSGLPVVQLAARRNDIDISIDKWMNHNILCYGEVFVARRDWALANLDSVKRFMSATQVSFLGALRDPSVAIQTTIRIAKIPAEQTEATRIAFEQSSELLYDETTRTIGFFAISRAKFRDSAQLMGFSEAIADRALATNITVVVP